LSKWNSSPVQATTLFPAVSFAYDDHIHGGDGDDVIDVGRRRQPIMPRRRWS